jgi:hypothetical protein
MKKATSIFSGLALTALLALSVLGQTPEMKPMTNDNAQSQTNSAQSAKHAKKKTAKKSQKNMSTSTGATKQSAKPKY